MGNGNEQDASGHMLFADILDYLDEGESIRRASWPIACYLRSNDTLKTFVMHAAGPGLLNRDGIPYAITYDDIFAQDWMVY